MTNTIPFLDLSAIHDPLGNELAAAFDRVIKSSVYVMGPELEAFEHEYAEYCEVEHTIGVGNGLDALRLGLLALGVQPGDEIIVPSHTFIATWLAVTDCKAIPVPVEPEEGTFTISARSVAAAITPRTRVIIPVHLYGQPVDLDPILALSRARGIKVLEDAAQAHGARYKGRRIGSHGDAVAWSFYPGKNLGALGDGGAVTTNDSDVADKVRKLRNYGSSRKYEHEIQGCNSRLDPLQAALLRIKLKHLDTWNNERREIATSYHEQLSDFERYGIQLPRDVNWAEHVWHLYVIQHPRRDLLQAQLTRAGVATQIHYPKPPHLQPACSGITAFEKKFPVAEKLSREVLSLPIYPGVPRNTAKMVAKIIREHLS